jgi:hypothetical protein
MNIHTDLETGHRLPVFQGIQVVPNREYKPRLRWIIDGRIDMPSTPSICNYVSLIKKSLSDS